VLTGLLIAAGVVAVLDWIAVYRQQLRLEYLAKPLALILLLIAAVIADLGPAHPWIVVGLACGLLGDTALLFDRPNGSDVPFLGGLGAFLVGHAFYRVGFVRELPHGALLVIVTYHLGQALIVLGLVRWMAVGASGFPVR
jgi:uncharacterized membrane protein YhhN